MTIDDDTLKKLLLVNDELMQLCKWPNGKRDIATSSRLIPARRRPNPHSDRRQIAVLWLTVSAAYSPPVISVDCLLSDNGEP
jgi:hypothetical protein